MIPPELVGAVILGVPAIFLAYVAFFFRRRPIFWFIVALVVVALGYLYATGALVDIGNAIIGDAEMIEHSR